MKVTLPDGTSIEGTQEELQQMGYLPPPPRYNWDGSPAITSSVSSVASDSVTANATTAGSGFVSSVEIVSVEAGDNVAHTALSGTKDRNGWRTIVEKCPDGVNERTTVVDEAGYVRMQTETLVAVPRKFVPMAHGDGIQLS